MKADDLLSKLLALSDPNIAEHSQRFFKTGAGEYGEGDKFIGIRVPVIRQTIKPYLNLLLADIEILLKSEVHEVRLAALLILVHRFKLKRHTEHNAIYQLFMSNIDQVNNWDLVDSSAHPIVGGHLFDKERDVLFELAASTNLWHRRIAIIATYHFIKRDQYDDTFALSKLLINDAEDLIHKAVGWMLREIGNRDMSIEQAFLKLHYHQMPRTMLRYAIEKFPATLRKAYLEGNV